MSVKVKINGKIKEFKTLQGAVNYLLHCRNEDIEFLREHGNGD